MTEQTFDAFKYNRIENHNENFLLPTTSLRSLKKIKGSKSISNCSKALITIGVIAITTIIVANVVGMFLWFLPFLDTKETVTVKSTTINVNTSSTESPKSKSTERWSSSSTAAIIESVTVSTTNLTTPSITSVLETTRSHLSTTVVENESMEPSDVIPEKPCKIRAQEISQFNGCSVPEWIPKDFVNSHGEKIVNYTQLFETDCNKHDICYSCGSHYNLSRADCDNLFYMDMLTTCENTYSSLWFDLIKKNLEDSEHNVNHTAICKNKAWHFKAAVEKFAESYYTGQDSWCKDSCIIQYLLGANSIPTKKEGQIDCGNGKRANSCEGCKSTVNNAENWCGGDCEWDEFLELCDTKLSFDFSDGDDLDF